jgi:hypothetical protein
MLLLRYYGCYFGIDFARSNRGNYCGIWYVLNAKIDLLFIDITEPRQTTDFLRLVYVSNVYIRLHLNVNSSMSW